MIGSLCLVLVAVVYCEVQSVIGFSHRKSNYTQNYPAHNQSENVGTSNASDHDHGYHKQYSQDSHIQSYSGPERFHSHNDGGQFGSKVKQSDFLHTTEHSHIESRHKYVHRSERDEDVSNSSSSSEEGFVKNEAIDSSRSMYFPSDERLAKPAVKKEKQPCQHRICEDVDNYPAEKIVEVISRSRELVGFFKNQPKPFEIDNRFGDDDDDTPCPTMKTKKFPKRALSTRNVEQLIVNVNDFQQGVDLEICKNEGSSCKFAEFPPHSYTTQCKQKYSKRLLMTFNEGKNDTIFDTFEFPSCCVCSIRRST
ncbi:unnamed protein product [Callosobruchus maculatus]|uniref:Spaetzle domain-containing protein n=1 Tax=Callosobruchus maculatus TaxID=64391 RepID=A0A653D6Y6_CALMS|nr:unnamed protein product [Callosobruchus maculatus]